MSSAAPTKRGRSKRQRPAQLKRSFGSASDTSGSLPSNMEANLSELVTQLKMRKQEVQDDCWYLEDANGNGTGRSPHNYSLQDLELDGAEAVENGTDSVGLTDPLVVARNSEVLTEADMADIVRRCRAFLEEHGPSHGTGLVRASYGSLVAFLSQQPGFHHTREGELSFVYYMDPDEEEEDSDAAPSRSPAAANATPLLADSP